MEKRKLVPLLLISFQNVIGFSLLIPVLPFVISQFGGSSIMYGALLATYALCQFIATPIIGALSDRYGRKPLLFVSFLGTLIGWSLFCASAYLPNPLVWIFIAQIIDGITGGNISVAGAYAIDISTPRERTKIFGYFGALFGIGFIIGPALGGLLAQTPLGYVSVGLFALALSVVTLLCIVFLLPESLHEHKRRYIHWKEAVKKMNVFAGIAQFHEKAVIQTLLVSRFFYALAFGMVNVAFTIYAQQYLKLNETQLGFLFLYIGIMIAVNQALIGRIITRKTGEQRAFYIGQAIFSIVILCFALQPNLLQTIGITAIMTFASALSYPTSRALLSIATAETQQGEVSGLDESLNALSRAIGPLVAGLLFQSLFTTSFVVIAVTFAVIQYIWLRRRHGM